MGQSGKMNIVFKPKRTSATGAGAGGAVGAEAPPNPRRFGNPRTLQDISANRV